MWRLEPHGASRTHVEPLMWQPSEHEEQGSLSLILWAQIAAAGPLRVSPVKSQIFEDYPRLSVPLMLDFMPVDQALWSERTP